MHNHGRYGYNRPSNNTAGKPAWLTLLIVLAVVLGFVGIVFYNFFYEPPPVPMTVRIDEKTWTQRAIIERYGLVEKNANSLFAVPEEAINVRNIRETVSFPPPDVFCTRRSYGGNTGGSSSTAYSCNYYRYSINDWSVPRGETWEGQTTSGTGLESERVVPAPQINKCDDVEVGCERVRRVADTYYLQVSVATEDDVASPAETCRVSENYWYAFETGAEIAVDVHNGNVCSAVSTAAYRRLQEIEG